LALSSATLATTFKPYEEGSITFSWNTLLLYGVMALKCYAHKRNRVNFALDKNKHNLISLSLVERHSLILTFHILV